MSSKTHQGNLTEMEKYLRGVIETQREKILEQERQIARANRDIRKVMEHCEEVCEQYCDAHSEMSELQDTIRSQDTLIEDLLERVTGSECPCRTLRNHRKKRSRTPLRNIRLKRSKTN